LLGKGDSKGKIVNEKEQQWHWLSSVPTVFLLYAYIFGAIFLYFFFLNVNLCFILIIKEIKEGRISE
jgi:hypothetical protein